jgi:GGDEF domain-containing protein
MRVTASIGVALFPTDAREPDALLRMADHAMYQAKSDGRADASFTMKFIRETDARAGRINQDHPLSWWS